MSTEDLLKALQKEYIENLPTKIKEIESYLSNGEMEKLQAAFHKLKGSGKTYGFEQISTLGREVEDVLKSKSERSIAVVKDAIATLKDLYNDFKPA